MSDPNHNKAEPIDPRLLISGYLDGKLTPAQFDEFRQWIHADRENARIFMRHCALVEHIREELRWSDVAALPIEEVETDAGVFELLSREGTDYAELLNRPDDPGESALQSSSGSMKTPINLNRTNVLTKQQLASAMTYILKHTFTRKRIAVLATAAALLLGVVLAIVLLTGPEPVQQVVEVPEPAKPTPKANIVATLTDTRDAVWGHVPGMALPRQGEGLYAGQRVHLLDGFAEVTTTRGARLTIQSPSVFEVDSDNSLRMVDGRVTALVPPAATGLTITTPNLKLTDIGTEFSVYSDQSTKDASGVTDVYVHKGEVHANQVRSNVGHAITLLQGDGVRASTDAQGLSMLELDTGGTSIARMECLRSIDDLAYRPTALVGAVEYLSSPPNTVHQGENERSDSAVMFLEKKGVELRGAVPVDFIGPGVATLAEKSIADPLVFDAGQGTRADTYLIHYDPTDADRASEQKIDVEVTFSNEIVGVIHNAKLLISTDDALGHDAVFYGTSRNRGLDSSDDGLEIEQNRRTIRVHMSAWQSDQVRILVRSTTPD